MVTNAHVVWPHDWAHIVFPNGEIHRNVPLLNWDLMTDLAVLGPVTTDIAPAILANGEEGAIGSETYLIGYPVGMESSSPQPAITRGLISRLREWESVGITYFQSDATIEAGQSGGVIVSDMGEVIGISGLSLGDFALSASMNDLLPRIRQLVADENVPDLMQRRIPREGGATKQRFPLYHSWVHQAFVIDAPPEERVDFRLQGSEGSYGVVNSMSMNLDLTDLGDNIYSTFIEYDVPHFLIVWQKSDESDTFLVESNRDLIPFDDPDDGKRVEVGQTIYGNIDYPEDLDYYLVELEAKSKIEITVDSLRIDPIVLATFKGAMDEEIAVDDNSGGGIWGLNAQLVYRAPFHNTGYLIAVGHSSSSDDEKTGGYVLSVRDVTER